MPVERPYRLGGASGIELCPKCDAENVGVIDSRPGALGRERRRRCRTCGYSWSTIEMVREDAIGVLGQEAVARGLAALRTAEADLRGLIAALEQADA